MTAEELLRRIRYQSRKPRALIGELKSLLRERAPDALVRAEVASALARFDETLPEEIAVWSPQVGSTYLLAIGGGGSVGRIEVVRRGGAHLRSIDAHLARQQMHVLFEVLTVRLAALKSGIPDVEGRGHELRTWMPGQAAVDGDSMGVAMSVALVSRWLDRSPRADTASSAAVGADGSLHGVSGLKDKVRALRERYPSVERVVVAPKQDPNGVEEALLLRRETLEDALEAHGLSLQDVRGRVDEARAREEVKALQYRRVGTYDAGEWRRNAHRARWLADVVRSRATLRARALGYAGLFHLHAGDAREADELLGQISEEALLGLPAGVRVSLRINAASAKVDRDPGKAIPIAEGALREALALTGEEREDCLGKAHGTLGRALMHASREVNALEHLRDAVEHHASHLPEERPQSLTHLATCKRRLGSVEEALQDATAALELSRGRGNDASEIFARYERARCLVELGELDAALLELDHVTQSQSARTDYPRLGCARYQVVIALQRGEPLRMWLEEAAERARGLEAPIKNVAAAPLAVALVSDRASLSPDLAQWLERTWRELFPTETPQAMLDALVY